MKLFGNWLPFIGVRTWPINNAGEPTEVQKAHFEADFLCMEWLGFGVMFAISPVRRPPASAR